MAKIFYVYLKNVSEPAKIRADSRKEENTTKGIRHTFKLGDEVIGDYPGTDVVGWHSEEELPAGD